jgi:hypothetical protein
MNFFFFFFFFFFEGLGGLTFSQQNYSAAMKPADRWQDSLYW